MPKNLTQQGSVQDTNIWISLGTVRGCDMKFGSHRLNYSVVLAYQCSLHNYIHICNCSGLDGWSFIPWTGVGDFPPSPCPEQLGYSQLPIQCVVAVLTSYLLLEKPQNKSGLTSLA